MPRWPHAAAPIRQSAELDRAIVDFDSAIRLAPTDTRALTMRGAAWRAKGEIDLAIADFTRALEPTPDDPSVRGERGATLHAAGHVRPALADFAEAIRLDPRLSSAYEYRGLSHLARGNLDAAIADLDEALRLDPADANTLSVAGPRICSRAILRAPVDYDAALRIAPEHAFALSAPATRISDAETLTVRIADYDRAIALGPIPVTLQQSRTCLARQGRFHAALSDLDNAIRLAPTDGASSTAAPGPISSPDVTPTGLADANKAIELDPNDANAYDTRGTIHAKLGRATRRSRISAGRWNSIPAWRRAPRR